MRRFFTTALPGSLLFLVVLLQCQQPTPLRKSVQMLHAPSHFFVTPRWSPDGKSLLVSGFQGVGLYRLEVGTQEVQTLLPAFVGRAVWSSSDTVDLHLFPGTGGSSEVVLDARMQVATRQIKEMPRPANQWTDPKTGLLHHIYWNQEGRRISYQWFRQRLQITAYEKVIFERDSVWGVAVSPDGHSVAFSEGLLSRGNLTVFDRGTLHNLGPGIHPKWSPDGQYLVFSRPEANDLRTPAPLLSTDQLKLTGADLYVWRRSDRHTFPLTQTPEQLELEPAFSPSGEHIAYADWKSGQIRIIPFAGRGE